MKPEADHILEKRSLDYLLTDAQVVLLILTKTGDILSSNPYADTFIRKPLEGGHIRDIILHDTWQEDLLQRWTTQKAPSLLNIRIENHLPATLYITVFSEDSRYFLFGHTDIGELQRLSEEILALNHDLTIMSRELQIRNTELAELNRLKNLFLGMASHDLRNPVGIILNYTDFILEDLQKDLSPQHLKFLQNIRSAAQDMKHVINDFLDVSIIESGHLTLNYEEIEPARFIPEVLEKVIIAADRRKISFQTLLDPLITRVRIDPKKIEQVFINLIKNAIEYSPQGGVITIATSFTDDEIRLSVQDQGAGISKEKQDLLFQTFSGTSARKKDGERSIGLGLVISRTIVEAHGGRMYVWSEPGVGSTFGFTLPCSCLIPKGPVPDGQKTA